MDYDKCSLSSLGLNQVRIEVTILSRKNSFPLLDSHNFFPAQLA